jgi:hypothetical protein
MFPPALAIQQANDAVPGTVPKIAGPNLYLQSDPTGKSAVWVPTVAAGVVPTLFYADQTARRAAALTVGMLYTVARQTSDGSLWIVIPPVSGATPVWGPLSSGPEVLFSGDFTSLLSGLTVRSFWQPHLSLVEDTTLAHTAGSGPAITLTGTRSGAPTSIVVTTTLGGTLGVWTGLLTYIDGTTQAFTSAATVALTGRGAGLTLNIAAGTAVIATDVWKAAAATLTDTITSNSLASNGSSTSGIIMPGVNGKATVASDGTRYWHNNTVDLPAPSFTLISAFRVITTPGSDKFGFAGDSGFFGSIKVLAAGGIDMYNGGVDANVNAGPTAGTWGLLIASYTGSALDSLKFGSASAVTGQNAGGTNPDAGRALGARIDGTFGCACEFGWGCWVDGGIPANIAAIVAANNTLYAGGIPG